MNTDATSDDETNPFPALAMHILKSNIVRGALIIGITKLLAHYKITSSVLSSLGLPFDVGTIADELIDWIGTYGGVALVIISRYLQKAAPVLVFTKKQAVAVESAGPVTSEPSIAVIPSGSVITGSKIVVTLPTKDNAG